MAERTIVEASRGWPADSEGFESIRRLAGFAAEQLRRRPAAPGTEPVIHAGREDRKAPGASLKQRCRDALVRLLRGEWRAPILQNVVISEAQSFASKPVVLHIGYRDGFDTQAKLLPGIAAEVASVVAIDPDRAAQPSLFREVHHCVFEEAPIAAGSINLAYAVMVLEHVSSPARFWRKMEQVLAAGGVFWGFTVDARNYVCRISRLVELLGVKHFCLDYLRGQKTNERHSNVPSRYLCNSPAQIAPFAAAFRRVDFINFAHDGQLDYLLPDPLGAMVRFVDCQLSKLGEPGTLLAVRLEK